MIELFKKPEVGPAAIQKLAGVEIETWLKVRTKREDLAIIEREAIEALADALESGAVVPGESSRLRKAREELSDLAAALSTLRSRRIASMEKARAEKVSALREQAASRRAQMEDLARKSANLFAKLGTLENIDVDPSKLLALPAGEWSGFAVPASVRMKAEAENLESIARRIEDEPLEASGVAEVEGHNLEDLVSAIYQHSGATITPSLSSIEAWFATSMQRAADYGDVEFPKPLTRPSGERLHLEWSYGEIAERNSFVEAFAARISLNGATALPHTATAQQIIAVEPLRPMERIYTRTFAERRAS
jgi:hypothetical protein